MKLDTDVLQFQSSSIILGEGEHEQNVLNKILQDLEVSEGPESELSSVGDQKNLSPFLRPSLLGTRLQSWDSKSGYCSCHYFKLY